MDVCVACAEEKLVWDCKEAGLFCNECYVSKCGGMVCINCSCIDDCECCECDEDDGKDLGEWRDIKCDDYEEVEEDESENESESEDDGESESEDEKIIEEMKGVDLSEDVKAKKVKADKPKCGGHKKNGDVCGFNAGESGFCKRHTPKAKVVEAPEETWGEWGEVSDDCEEDPDFEYEYEEIWV